MKFAKIISVLLVALFFNFISVEAAVNPNFITVFYPEKIPVIATVDLRTPEFKNFKLERGNLVIFFEDEDKISSLEKRFKVKLKLQKLETLTENQIDFIKFHISENYEKIGVTEDAPFTVYKVTK